MSPKQFSKTLFLMRKLVAVLILTLLGTVLTTGCDAQASKCRKQFHGTVTETPDHWHQCRDASGKLLYSWRKSERG